MEFEMSKRIVGKSEELFVTRLREKQTPFISPTETFIALMISDNPSAHLSHPSSSSLLDK
jgi:hypothetical protein